MIAFEQHLLLVMRDIIQVLPSTEQQQLERPLQDLETFGALTSDAEVLSTQLDASMELGDILQTLTSTLRRIGSVVNTLLHGQSSLESVPM